MTECSFLRWCRAIPSRIDEVTGLRDIEALRAVGTRCGETIKFFEFLVKFLDQILLEGWCGRVAQEKLFKARISCYKTNLKIYFIGICRMNCCRKNKRTKRKAPLEHGK